MPPNEFSRNPGRLFSFNPLQFTRFIQQNFCMQANTRFKKLSLFEPLLFEPLYLKVLQAN